MATDGPFSRRRLINELAAFRRVALATTGTLIYVHSVTGTDDARSDRGTRPNTPYATLAYAITKATASQADVIVLLPGHAETIDAAADIDVSKIGLQVVGMGTGSLRPTFTFSTDTAATLVISATSCLLSNIRFVGNIDDLAKFLDVNEGQFTAEGLEFVTSSTKEALSFIDLATTKDDFVIRRCKFLQPTDPAGTNGAAGTGAIYVVDSENILVEDCVFDGFFETACLHNKTTAAKYITWRNNTVNQQLTDAQRILTPVGTVGCSFGPDSDFVPGRGYPAKRATAGLPATTTTNYFAIVGGNILLTELTGEVTTVIQTQACNTKWQLDPTAAGSNVDLCAVLDVTAKVVGSLFAITGTLTDAMVNGQAVAAQAKPIACPPGNLALVTAATNTGSVKWAAYWMPADYSLGVPNVIAV